MAAFANNGVLITYAAANTLTFTANSVGNAVTTTGLNFSNNVVTVSPIVNAIYDFTLGKESSRMSWG